MYDSASAASWIAGAKSTPTRASNAGAGAPAITGTDVNPALPSSSGHSTRTVPDA